MDNLPIWLAIVSLGVILFYQEYRIRELGSYFEDAPENDDLEAIEEAPVRG